VHCHRTQSDEAKTQHLPMNDVPMINSQAAAADGAAA